MGSHIEMEKPTTICLLPPANKVWGKVMFSQVFVCPRGESAQPPGGRPSSFPTPGLEADPLDAVPRGTVNKRAVRILLECILAS